MSKPSHIAYTVRSYKGSDGTERKSWNQIGAAWPTKFGNGFNLDLFALPVDGKLTLFAPSDKPSRDEPA